MVNINIGSNGEVFINGVRMTANDNTSPRDPNPEPRVTTHPDTPKLSLNLSSAKVEIKQGREPGVRVVVEGSQAFIDAVTINESDGVLTIKESYSSPGTVFSSSTIVVGGMSILNSSFNSSDDAGVITITMPDNVALDLVNHGTGSVDVAPLLASLSARLTGTGPLNVEYSIGDVVIKSSGTGRVRINNGEVNTLSISSTGTSGVHYGGFAQDVSVTTSGTGSIELTGTVHDAVLRSSGTGGIRARNVTGNLTKRSSGTGRIRTGK